MRRFRFAVVAVAVLATGAALGKDCKIGYIDVPRIFEEYEAYKKARKDLDRDRGTREEEFAKRAAELKEMGREIQESMSLLSESKRREREQAYMKRAQDLEEWRMKENQALQEREEGLVKRLEGDVRKALESIGDKGKFSFVVRGDLLLYMDDDAVDLTDRVLDTLRAHKQD